MHISAGSKESLLDDTLQFAAKAKQAGVDVSLEIGEGMCHCYPAFLNLFKESEKTMDEICEFLKKQVEKN